MRILCVVASLLVVSASVYADVFKCKVGGKTVYQEQPCPDGAGETVRVVNDQPDELERLRAENRALRAREVVGYGSGTVDPNVSDFNQTSRDINREENQNRADREKEARCLELSRRSSDMNSSSNARAEANYQALKMDCH